MKADIPAGASRPNWPRLGKWLIAASKRYAFVLTVAQNQLKPLRASLFLL
jgi:hypothetical protein